ncbi:serine/threonine protein kinase [Brachybacterium halotolerans subsp. kimchii]|uniref:serine/threonine-protein kinase n=1 Tax=Brachybacterium halotolerans TaxID=2795215 RepID=UPI001E485DAB|nr:serine/threonine-protein kinase [Brachybacterium halotolerans]UEJ82076.1 serine/threonine protein kinase [Brachybacterium halotolerans subsp. kimchii]
MRTGKGLVLEGRYRLDSLIATGGMGEVWKGWDQDLDRETAVKVLREEYAFDEGFLKRFRAEARHTASLSHDTIAALYDYGEIDGRAYIVMELCKGRPLSEIIEEHPDGLPEDRVVSVLIDLARALDAAHAKGVVHRDVKPENILVDDADDWHMKITDFGIARSQDQARLTKTGLVMGTAQYLSPEQAMGKQATSLSDLYALGIVAYEMLVGHRPFTGASQVEIAMAQVKKQPPALPESVSPDLRHLVMMLLAKAPANRPRSAAAVARILESIQRGEEPRFTTGAIPAGAAASGASAASGGSASSGSTGENRAGSGKPSASPVGTRTAAMPLPRTHRRRGIRHRSGTSGPSALSGASAPSASESGGSGSRGAGARAVMPASGSSRTPSASRLSGPGSPVGSASVGSPAAPGAPSGPGASAGSGNAASSGAAPAGGADPGISTATSGRTSRSTSTGSRIGPFTVPGFVLLLIVIVVAAVAIGMGVGIIPSGFLSGEAAHAAHARTMFASPRIGDLTRTVGQ